MSLRKVVHGSHLNLNVLCLYRARVFVYLMTGLSILDRPRSHESNVKPAFHGACFGAVSAPILSARVPRRASAAFEKERFHCEHSSCFHERRLPR